MQLEFMPSVPIRALAKRNTRARPKVALYQLALCNFNSTGVCVGGANLAKCSSNSTHQLTHAVEMLRATQLQGRLRRGPWQCQVRNVASNTPRREGSHVHVTRSRCMFLQATNSQTWHRGRGQPVDRCLVKLITLTLRRSGPVCVSVARRDNVRVD